MPLFHYKSLSLQGRKQTGVIDAPSLKEAKEKLRSQGTIVIAIGSKQTDKSLFKKKVELSAQHLLNFTTQLSQLLSAAIPLYESLLSLEEQYRNEPFHPILASLCEQIKAGASLSSAMKNFPNSFDQLYCAMVAAGESIGALDKTLNRLTELLAKQQKLRKQIITAMIYPAVLGSFSLLVIFLLLTFAIPSIEAIFAEREVNGFTHLVILTSHLLTGYWHMYLPLIGGTCHLSLLFLRSGWGRAFKHRLALKLPLIKKVILQSSLARFSRTLGTLQQGGVSIIDALQISRKVMKNPILERIFEKAEEKIIEGSSLATELRRSPLLPPLISRMLAIGEESGDSALMLNKVAELYEDEVEKTLTRLTALAQPAILLIMGAVVGIIMLAILLPLTDISSFTG